LHIGTKVKKLGGMQKNMIRSEIAVAAVPYLRGVGGQGGIGHQGQQPTDPGQDRRPPLCRQDAQVRVRRADRTACIVS
jgi:hypothetical protein